MHGFAFWGKRGCPKAEPTCLLRPIVNAAMLPWALYINAFQTQQKTSSVYFVKVIIWIKKNYKTKDKTHKAEHHKQQQNQTKINQQKDTQQNNNRSSIWLSINLQQILHAIKWKSLYLEICGLCSRQV